MRKRTTMNENATQISGLSSAVMGYLQRKAGQLVGWFSNCLTNPAKPTQPSLDNTNSSFI